MTTDAPLTGIARAREVLGKLEANSSGRPDVFAGMAAHAAALATVELAAATQLSTLVALTRGDGWIHHFTPDERVEVLRRIRMMLGFDPDITI